jgi:sugar phosphate isomerase/epimerase
MMNRRQLLQRAASGVPAFLAANICFADDPPAKTRMGITAASLANWASAKQPTPADFLAHCRELGAAGIQTSLRILTPQQAESLQRQAEEWEMYIEGSVKLPADRDDVARFDAEVRTAGDCGAQVLRTVALDGRRYETFHDAESFRQFAERSWRSLALAERVVAKRKVRLALENHKDWRIEELLAGLKRLDSEFVGVCVDTGNSIALLEDPLTVVEAYAPWAFSVHFKDMGVREYAEGFLLAEVPFGEGILALSKMTDVLRTARPEVRFNLEMITRDPLRVPCLTDGYWVTLAGLSGRELAHTLALVKDKGAREPLPAVSELTAEDRVRVEEENVHKCLAFARERLRI